MLIPASGMASVEEMENAARLEVESQHYFKSIFDVIIDLRPNSKTFKKWCSFELTEDNYKMLYIPKGFAHGFQTLEDNTEISYQISEFYHPEYAKGIRWDDKTFRIEWPLNVSLISENDLDYTPFEK